MAEVVYEYSKTINWTDPSVRVDREMPTSTVMKPYQPGTKFDVTDFTRVDAIKYPVVAINDNAIMWKDISYMKLSSTGTVPELILEINDRMGNIRLTTSPGMACKITVVLTMPIDGAYRKISCDFWPTRIDYSGPMITYICQFYFPGIRDRLCKSWETPDGKYPTTYELIELIAKESGLGFAATDQCKEINDTRPRLARAQTVLDVINQHVSFGGVDSNSIFDWWVDLWGYIVLVNLPFVFNEKIPSDKLQSHIITGLTPDNPEYTEQLMKYSDLVPRLLVNDKSLVVPNNTTFTAIEDIIDNSAIMMDGTENTYFSVATTESGGNNSIAIMKGSVTENSDAGDLKKSVYTFDRSEFIGCEWGNADTDTKPILFQKREHDLYINSMKARHLKVTLFSLNFAYTRGILLTLIRYEYNPYNKQYILNLIKSDPTADGVSVKPLNGLDHIITDKSSWGVIDVMRNGQYYVDGVEFEFDTTTNRVIQNLFLVKKGNYHDYTDYLREKVTE